MSVTRRVAHCTPDALFAVLSEGWLYATWVVGAARIRRVDDDWPNQGARVHHSVGLWPLLLDDHTEVLECEPPRRLVLKGRGWPVGEVTVEIDIEPTPAGCTVTMSERVTSGPAKVVPDLVLDRLLDMRNVEALRRLVLLAEGRTTVDPTAPAS